MRQTEIDRRLEAAVAKALGVKLQRSPVVLVRPRRSAAAHRPARHAA